MASQFYSLYTHDFVRIASCVPRTRVATVFDNLAETFRLAQRADALKAAIVIFPALGLSAYAIEDLLFQDALLDAVERAIDQLVNPIATTFPRPDRRGAAPTPRRIVQLRGSDPSRVTR
jgi:NAD+ synthase (glutamine-hydrolysing)